MKRKRIEFSKIIFIGVSTITIAVVVFSFLMIYKTGDLSPLSYLIPSIFAELATATGFYYQILRILEAIIGCQQLNRN